MKHPTRLGPDLFAILNTVNIHLKKLVINCLLAEILAFNPPIFKKLLGLQIETGSHLENKF